MTDQSPTDPKNDPIDIPYGEAMEEETPRREASAQFVVESDVGSEAALRDAMDPANQSLTEALRLSFRILQVVILVLVVLFVFSGVTTVEEGQSGVLTRWGRILEVDGDRSLDTGFQFSLLPYPAGEFILFQDRNRSSDVGAAFWPDLGSMTYEQALGRANVTAEMSPRHNGYLITKDGDLAHLQLSAKYQISDPAGFITRMRGDDADRIVSLAMQRACVQVASTLSLQDVVDLHDEHKDAIRDAAQAMLDDLDSGIVIESVAAPTAPSAPLAIEQIRRNLQEASVSAQREIVWAMQRYEEVMTQTAGEAHRELIGSIEAYEDAREAGAPDTDERLQAIMTLLDSDTVGGEVSTILADAKAYESQVKLTLGTEARRFQYLLDNFRRHPELVVQERWTQAYNNVLNGKDAEIFFFPTDMAVKLSLARLDDVAQTRRRMRLERMEAEAQADVMGEFDRADQFIRQDDMFTGAGRQLEKGEDGKLEQK